LHGVERTKVLSTDTTTVYARAIEIDAASLRVSRQARNYAEREIAMLGFALLAAGWIRSSNLLAARRL